jgi:hypothetical protein
LSSREKWLNTVLAILVIVPTIVNIISIAWPGFGDIIIGQGPVDFVSPAHGAYANSASLFSLLYYIVVLTVALMLLRATNTIAQQYKWLWIPALILLLPLASLALIVRVYRGKPAKIPRTVEEQRQILLEKAAEIRARNEGTRPGE